MSRDFAAARHQRHCAAEGTAGCPDAFIERQLRAHHDLARRLDLVLSIPGLAMRTSAPIIIACLNWTGQPRRKPQLSPDSPRSTTTAAAQGRAPYRWRPADCGRSLYAAAHRRPSRWNKALVVLYARLTAQRQTSQCRLIACARSWLIYANTVVARYVH